ncbi:11490_t:CDS:2, partial [Racocetra fulgida]
DYEWIFFAYVPDNAKVRDKTLYASTRATLTKELGDYRFVDSMHGTAITDFSLEEYERHKRHKNAEAPLTQREKELAEVRAAESLDVKNERIELDSTSKIDIDELANTLSSEEPRFSFFTYEHSHEGQEYQSTSNYDF